MLEYEDSEGKKIIRRQQGLLVEKCRFLESAGCARTCLHACKIPTQRFFLEEMGLPVTLSPNMTDFRSNSCLCFMFYVFCFFSILFPNFYPTRISTYNISMWFHLIRFTCARAICSILINESYIINKQYSDQWIVFWVTNNILINKEKVYSDCSSDFFSYFYWFLFLLLFGMLRQTMITNQSSYKHHIRISCQ